MGSKRVGLARVQALIENLKRELNLEGTTLKDAEATGDVAQGAENTPVNLGCKKVQAFAGSLANIQIPGTDGAVQYTADDVLVYLGTLDTTVPEGLSTVSQVIIDKVTVVVSTAAGTSLAGNLALDDVATKTSNQASSDAVEIFGAGATQLSPEGYGLATTATEADINFNATGLTFCRPSITQALSDGRINLYARTTTALNADATAGRFNVLVEYTVL